MFIDLGSAQSLLHQGLDDLPAFPGVGQFGGKSAGFVLPAGFQVQEAQGFLNKMNRNRPTIRHIIKMSNVKGKENSKGSKRKSQIQGNSLRAIS